MHQAPPAMPGRNATRRRRIDDPALQGPDRGAGIPARRVPYSLAGGMVGAGERSRGLTACSPRRRTQYYFGHAPRLSIEDRSRRPAEGLYARLFPDGAVAKRRQRGLGLAGIARRTAARRGAGAATADR